jgi:hypothetical protein
VSSCLVLQRQGTAGDRDVTMATSTPRISISRACISLASEQQAQLRRWGMKLRRYGTVLLGRVNGELNDMRPASRDAWTPLSPELLWCGAPKNPFPLPSLPLPCPLSLSRCLLHSCLCSLCQELLPSDTHSSESTNTLAHAFALSDTNPACPRPIDWASQSFSP